jgi:hypothetical protein
VQVTNVGAQADTFDLSVFGALSLGALLTPNSVTLSPGQAQTVQLQANASTEALAGSLMLGALAQSHINNTVRNEDAIEVQIETVRAASAEWKPTTVLITSSTRNADLIVKESGQHGNRFPVGAQSSRQHQRDTVVH